MALFPDVTDERRCPGWQPTLHVFAGSVPLGHYLRCDVMGDVELRCSVFELPARCGLDFELVIADPPYTAADAARYGTAPISRVKAMAALAAVTRRGGHLAWLDTCWPMHSKREWLTVGRILVQRSTNHRVRVLTLFERQ